MRAAGRRAAGVALAVLALAAGRGEGAWPGERRPELLPDVGPPPRVVAMAASSARRAMLRNSDLVTEVVNALPASTRVLILTNDRSAFTVAGRAEAARVRFVELPFSDSLTIWPQDPFLVLTDGGETVLLTSRTFERADDRLMAAAIAEAAGCRVEESELSFEGGNIVSDRDHVLIGADTIRANAVDLDVSEVEVVLRFEAELGRPATVVGPVPQPVAHLDMMLTPLGDGRLAVADAGAGADVAEAALEDAPEEVRSFERWCEEHFFGRPSIRRLRGPDGPVRAPDLIGGTAEMVADSRRIAPVLDGVARSLAAAGFVVERVPFLFGGPGSQVAGHGRAASLTKAAYPMLTYNNVLVVDGGGDASVYLPRYGLDRLDRTAAKDWEGIGFEVHPVDGLAVSAMYGGSLRCSVKVLQR